MSLTLMAAALTLAPATKPDIAVYKNLAVYPMLRGATEPQKGEYISLDEGLKSGLVVVTEAGSQTPPLIRSRTGSRTGRSGGRQTFNQQNVQSGSGTVDTLWLTNKSGKKLILLSGEIVSGGKQDRIVQKDVLIPSGKEAINLSVFCVEHGRWAQKTVNFAPAAGGAGGLADPSVRGKAQHERNQQAVWGQVDVSLSKLKTDNATKTYQQNLSDTRVRGTVEEYVKAIEAQFPASLVNGAVVAINGKLLWMDRFDSNEVFRKYWPKMIRSYVLEALQTDTKARFENPNRNEAMQFALGRDGKVTSEAEEGVWKLVKVDAKDHVIYELMDLTGGGGKLIHASKMTK